MGCRVGGEAEGRGGDWERKEEGGGGACVGRGEPADIKA